MSLKSKVDQYDIQQTPTEKEGDNFYMHQMTKT